MQLSQAPDAKELHRTFNVSGENIGGPLHAVLPTGHEAIQVCPTNKRCTRPEGDCCNDVTAVHDSTVHIHLCIRTDRVDNRLYEEQRRGGAVELAATVVREYDSIRTQIDHTPGVLDRLDPLHHDRSIPLITEPHKIIEVERWVEETIRRVSDSATERREGGKRQRFGGQEVEPTDRMSCTIEGSSCRQLAK